ncbi:uncharacterized protein DS421_16g542380 [Arachis hypogaea]|nr:uncharacterized protein DS421_16g542380 [Arachis hypogaea]
MNTVVPMEIQNFVELVTKSLRIEDCARKEASARMNRQELPPMSFNRYMTT